MSTHGSDPYQDWDEPTDGAASYERRGHSHDDHPGQRSDPTFDADYEPTFSHHDGQDSDWVADTDSEHFQDHDQQLFSDDQFIDGSESADQYHPDSPANDGHYEEYDEYSGQYFRSNLDVTGAAPVNRSGQFSPNDFRDARPLHSGGGFKKFALMSGSLIVLSVLAFKMVVSSLPELSKLDIVQMDGYGEQSVRKVYYSNQLPCDSTRDCSPTNGQGANKSALIKEIAEHQMPVTDENASTRYLAEIPAALVSSDAYEGYNPADTTSADSSLGQLEQKIVRLQWSNVRAEPNSDSDILRTLDIGTMVTVTGVIGRWFEIETTGDDLQRGYMHSSTISAPKRPGINTSIPSLPVCSNAYGIR